MRRVVVVELDVEAGKITLVFGTIALDQGFGLDAFFTRTQHDRCAVRVAGTYISAVMTDQLLKPHPDIGLDVLDQMPDMDRTVGVRQGAGDEDFARHG